MTIEQPGRPGYGPDGEEEDWVVWDAGRQLRNLASHPDDQTILPPSSAAATLRRTADAVNGLFERAWGRPHHHHAGYASVW